MLCSLISCVRDVLGEATVVTYFPLSNVFLVLKTELAIHSIIYFHVSVV